METQFKVLGGDSFVLMTFQVLKKWVQGSKDGPFKRRRSPAQQSSLCTPCHTVYPEIHSLHCHPQHSNHFQCLSADSALLIILVTA
jgi:hypothetical protein